MLTQQAIYAHPLRTVLRRSQIVSETTPWVGQKALLGLEKPGTHGIQMHIIAGCAQISVAAPFNHLRFVSAAQNMTDEFVPMIDSNRVGALQPTHPCNKIAVRSFHHQVVMVAHETIGVNLPISFLARLSQGFEEILPVHNIQENILASVASTHDVV